MPTTVTADTFARAETDRMFADLAAQAGGVNRWRHSRMPTPIDEQTVIRMNRDTLYSFVIVDLAAGATLTVPDAGDRYLSVMAVNNDHFVNRIYHDAGRYVLTAGELGTRYVALAVRILVDASDPVDLTAVATLQDQLWLDAGSATPFEPAAWDKASLDAIRGELLERARAGVDSSRAFGRREDVDPEIHRIATAAGWGGLPASEASYIVPAADLSVGAYRLTARDVPVDAFWSISVYNAAGFFEPNDRGAYNVNSVSGTKNPDGSMTVHFGGCDDDRVNCLPITDGWNYAVRLYLPRAEVLDGSYAFPAPERIG